MKFTSITRRIIEELDYCNNYKIIDPGTGTISIFFYYDNPLDVVIWKLDKEFFDIMLENIFDKANSKLKT